MKTVTEKGILIKDLRANLKEFVAKELQQLPAYLEALPPKEKVDYLLKLMPYVFPKVESVHFKKDEIGNSWVDDH